MSSEQKWEAAVEMCEFTGRVLKDVIKAVHHEASGHAPSLTQALSFSRSAFIEAQDYERKCFETMNEPEVDPNQTQMPIKLYENTSGQRILAHDEVNDAKKELAPGEEWLVCDPARVSFVVLEESVALEPAGA